MMRDKQLYKKRGISKMKYIVTGVDGQLGRRVAKNMLDHVDGNALIFTAPNLNRIPREVLIKWKSEKVEIREGNYDDKEGLQKAFDGGTRIFFVSSVLNGAQRVAQHKNVIDACEAAGVRHITYTSFLGANRAGYNQYVLPDHRATEKYLTESGVEYNIMRNNLYMENYLTTSVMLAMLSNNVWGTTAGEGKATYIAKDDSAACAAALLLGNGEKNTGYDLTSLNPVSQREICAMIREKSQIDFKYVPMNSDEYYQYLDALNIPRTTDGDTSKAPVLWCSNDMVTNEAGIAEGQMGIISHDVEKLLGRKPLEVADLLERYSYIWKEKVDHWSKI